MKNQAFIIKSEETKLLISELCLTAYANYGDKQVTITLHSHIPLINVMVGNGYRTDSYSNYSLNAADTEINLKAAIVYLRSLQVEDKGQANEH